MKKVKILGRSIPILAIVAIAASAGMVGAALLTYYGTIEMTADVQQSVLVDGGNYLQPNIYGGDTVAGNTIVDGPHNLLNQSDVPITIAFGTTQTGDGSPDGNVVGITTTYTTTITEESSADAYYSNARIMAYLIVRNMTVSEFLAEDLEYTANVISNPLYVPNICFWITDGTNTYVVEAWGKDWTGTGLHTVTIQDMFDGTTAYEVTVDTNYGQANRISPDRPGTYATWKGTGIAEFIEDYDTWTVLSAQVRAQAGAAGGQVIRPVQFKAAGTTINIPDSYSITSLTLQSGELLNFYIVNMFDAALVPGTYIITTTIEPVV